MAIKTIYGFDEDGKKVPIGTYNDVLTISLAADDPDGHPSCDGVSSSGLYSNGSYINSPLITEYDSGDSCTLSATSISTIQFNSWKTTDGTVLSTSNPYTFTVTESMEIVCHFTSGGSGGVTGR